MPQQFSSIKHLLFNLETDEERELELAGEDLGHAGSPFSLP